MLVSVRARSARDFFWSSDGMLEENKNEERTGYEEFVSLWQVYAMPRNKKTGVDLQINPRAEAMAPDIFCNTDVFGDGFTRIGRFRISGFTRLLEALSREYEVEVQIFCSRRIRR